MLLPAEPATYLTQHPQPEPLHSKKANLARLGDGPEPTLASKAGLQSESANTDIRIITRNVLCNNGLEPSANTDIHPIYLQHDIVLQLTTPMGLSQH